MNILDKFANLFAKNKSMGLQTYNPNLQFSRGLGIKVLTPDLRFDPGDLAQLINDDVVIKSIQLICNYTLGNGYLVKSKFDYQQKIINNFLKSQKFEETSRELLNSILGCNGSILSFFIQDERGNPKLIKESFYWNQKQRILAIADEESKELLHYEVRSSYVNKIYQVSKEKSFLLNSYNFENDFVGKSPLMYASSAVKEKQALSFMNRQNGLEKNRLEGFLSPKESLFTDLKGNEKLQYLANLSTAIETIQLNESNSTQNYPLIPPADFVNIKSNNKDMELINRIRQLNYAICGYYCVPPSMVGFDQTTDPNLSNGETLKDIFISSTVDFYKTLLENYWTWVLQNVFVGWDFEFFIGREQTDETLAIREQLMQAIDVVAKLKAIGIDCEPDLSLINKLGINIKETKDLFGEVTNTEVINKQLENKQNQVSIIDEVNMRDKAVPNPKEEGFYDSIPLNLQIRQAIDNVNLYRDIGHNPKDLEWYLSGDLFFQTDKGAFESQLTITNDDKITVEVADGTLAIWENKEKDSTKAKKILDWKGRKIGVQYSIGDIRHNKKMNCIYGYLINHRGEDKMALDVYVGGDFSSDRIFRVEQINPKTGELDEYKFMLGFLNLIQAKGMYLKAIPLKFFGGIQEVSITELDKYQVKKEQLPDDDYLVNDKAILSQKYQELNPPSFQKLEKTEGYKDFKKQLKSLINNQLNGFFENINVADKAFNISDELLFDYIKQQLPTININSEDLYLIMNETIVPETLKLYNDFYNQNYTMATLPSTVKDSLLQLANLTIQGKGIYQGIDETLAKRIYGLFNQIKAGKGITIEDYSSVPANVRKEVWSELQKQKQTILLQSRTDLISQIIANNNLNQVVAELSKETITGATFAGVKTVKDPNVRPTHEVNEGKYFNITLKQPWLDPECRCQYIFGTEDYLKSLNFKKL